MDSKADEKNEASTRRLVDNYRYSVPNARNTVSNPNPRPSAPTFRASSAAQLERESIATELSITAAFDEMSRSMDSLIAGDMTGIVLLFD